MEQVRLNLITCTISIRISNDLMKSLKFFSLIFSLILPNFALGCFVCLLLAHFPGRSEVLSGEGNGWVLLLDSQQLVVFGEALGPTRGTALDVTGADGH
uniref:Uncharacterized protein n=1 Tax=Chloropicon laureae TaxID=464258 RepID=A0A7S2Z6Z0_9CHLO